MGHRDSIPEDSLAFLRWSRNFLIQNIKNAKRWNIPPFAIQELKLSYIAAKAAYEECPEDPPPEPDLLDGFTIYWDKKKRMNELIGDFLGIETDKNGRFNREELLRLLPDAGREERFRQWQEYLLNIARENAARYHMPDEWVEAIRRRQMDEPLPQKQDEDGDNMQQILFMFYRTE